MNINYHICNSMSSNVAIIKYEDKDWNIYITGECKFSRTLESHFAEKIKFCPYCGVKL